MRVSKNLAKKFYYMLADFLIRKNPMVIPDFLKHSANIFLYFDYEREFGGHETQIVDKDIYKLLKILKHYNIKTTWFTVGRIFEKYPDSISAIIRSGHEIGSHTYAHYSPLCTSHHKLNYDFKKFSEVSGKHNVKGFHSPNGEWSLYNLKQYFKHDFTYDVVSCKRLCLEVPSLIKTGNRKVIIRLQTIGDDWPLFNRNLSVDEVYKFYCNYIERLKAGEIMGIGFHPWILFSNENNLKGFDLFLKSLKTMHNIRLETAEFYVAALKNNLLL